MTQIPSLAAADRNRLIQDALRLRDQQREAVQRQREQSFADNLRQREITEGGSALAARRIQDRRDVVEGLRADQDQQRDRQRARDFINNDTHFVRRQYAIEDEQNASRDGRDLNESLLLRDIAGEQNEIAELRSVQQRSEDLRNRQIEREARIVERRVQERNDDIRQEQALRRSVDQIRNAATAGSSGAERPRGGLLDVSG
ncbi:MAG: hypothetical protein HOH04_11530 [Rhodospirillaceae bacterium]|nr:hypothetical protein [Rhodospirillaceae bacterium]